MATRTSGCELTSRGNGVYHPRRWRGSLRPRSSGFVVATEYIPDYDMGGTAGVEGGRPNWPNAVLHQRNNIRVYARA